MKYKGQKRMKRKEKERTTKSLLDPLRDRQHEKTCVNTSTAVEAILGLNLKVGVMNRRTGRDRA